MSIAPSTGRRAPAHTAAQVNRRIEKEVEASVAHFAEHPGEIGDRLEQLPNGGCEPTPRAFRRSG